MSINCADCTKELGWWRSRRPFICAQCGKKPLCPDCADNALPNPAKPTEIIGMCNACFEKHSSVDFSSPVEILTPSDVNAKDSASTTEEPSTSLTPKWVILVHGGGGCRAMFRPLARALAAAGYHCLLPDLPGHGARYMQPLSCVSDAVLQLKSDIETYIGKGKDAPKPVYIGGSLGGYMGMEFLGKFPDMCSAAVILMAGQTVGAGASFAASAALNMMWLLSNALTNVRTGSMMMNIVGKHKDLKKDVIDECSLKPGFFFRSRNGQVLCLTSTNSLAAMKKYKGPVLYMNGTKDHRDMEDKLVAVSKQNHDASELYDFKDADHFFSHDARYIDDFTSRVVAFVSKHCFV